jgi:hypothetical protein
VSRQVILEWREVGQRFGCQGLVHDARTRRVLHRTQVRPYGMTATVLGDALAFAVSKDWEVLE